MRLSDSDGLRVQQDIFTLAVCGELSGGANLDPGWQMTTHFHEKLGAGYFAAVEWQRLSQGTVLPGYARFRGSRQTLVDGRSLAVH